MIEPGSTQGENPVETSSHADAQDSRYTRRRRQASAARPTSTADLLRELRDESSLLIRQEIALAKAELKESAAKAAKSSLTVTIGAVVALMGVALLTVALSFGLAQLMVLAGAGVTMANFLGFLIGAFLFLIAGAVAGYLGWEKLSDIDFYPRRTIDHLKEETKAFKDRI